MVIKTSVQCVDRMSEVGSYVVVKQELIDLVLGCLYICGFKRSDVLLLCADSGVSAGVSNPNSWVAVASFSCECITECGGCTDSSIHSLIRSVRGRSSEGDPVGQGAERDPEDR